MKTASNRAPWAKKMSIIVLAVMVTIVFFGCKESPYINAPGDNGYNYDSIPVIVLPDPVDYEGANIPEGCLNVYEAIHVCDSIGKGNATKDKYYVKGWIRSLHSSNESGILGSYHNATFYIAATNDGYSDLKMFEAYHVKGPNNSDITDLSQIQIGDFVVVYSALKNYDGTAETDNGGYIYYSSNPNLQ